MSVANLTEFEHLSEICHRLGYRHVGGKRSKSWVLETVEIARTQELSGEGIRCAFCGGPITLHQAGINGQPAHMVHQRAQDAKGCVVSVDNLWDGRAHRMSTAPVRPEVHEDPAERERINQEILSRYPNINISK